MDQPDAQSFWEKRYLESEQVWSGQANQALVSVVGALAAGRALDLGCGEGGDSIWLAEQGWQVAAVDISATAVARGQAGARAAGLDARISWVVADLAGWSPSDEHDLVSACFLHSPVTFPRTEVLLRCAEAVPPGGRLLVVGHALAPPWARLDDHDEHRFLGPDEELAELQLDPGVWDVEVAETRERDATGPEGERATLVDSVVLARRR